MNILVGKIFSWPNDPVPAIEIGSAGIFRASAGDQQDGFDVIRLRRKDLVNIRNAIDRELAREGGNGHATEGHMERHEGCYFG